MLTYIYFYLEMNGYNIRQILIGHAVFSTLLSWLTCERLQIEVKIKAVEAKMSWLMLSPTFPILELKSIFHQTDPAC